MFSKSFMQIFQQFKLLSAKRFRLWSAMQNKPKKSAVQKRQMFLSVKQTTLLPFTGIKLEKLLI